MFPRKYGYNFHIIHHYQDNKPDRRYRTYCWQYLTLNQVRTPRGYDRCYSCVETASGHIYRTLGYIHNQNSSDNYNRKKALERSPM